MDKYNLIKSLEREGFSKKILKAFEKVHREDFVPDSFKHLSYEDDPLPIGHGQTISQPYTIAFMLELLELEENQKILEIGSGCGYVLALINQISKNSEIFGIERIKELFDSSKKILKKFKNIKIIFGDGSKGFEKQAPFDRILVSAAGERIPEELINQLKINGILVMPVKDSIICLKKTKQGNRIKRFQGFRFVRLIED